MNLTYDAADDDDVNCGGSWQCWWGDGDSSDLSDNEGDGNVNDELIMTRR